MQRISILLTLLILSTPVSSTTSDDYGKDPKKYHTYPSGFDSYQSQSKISVREDPHYLKLLIKIKNDQKIVTVKT